MNDLHTIEPLGQEHLRDVALLERECFNEPWSENSLRMLLGDEGFGVVAILDGEVVGYGGVMLALDECQITDIAVRSDCRRRGIGMDIVKAIISRARTLGMYELYLEVRQSNLAARELYISCGFEECGIRRDFYRRPRESAVVMKYKIENIKI